MIELENATHAISLSCTKAVLRIPTTADTMQAKDLMMSPPTPLPDKYPIPDVLIVFYVFLHLPNQPGEGTHNL